MSAAHKDLSNEDYVTWIRFLRDADDWSRERIAEHELAEVRRVVDFAYTNTVGYRELLDSSGFHPRDLRTLDNVAGVPFLTKEMIRDNLEDFSVQVAGRFYVTTGGSTGIPTGMYRDPSAFAKELASKAHQYHRIGWREGDRQIVFRGLLIDTPDGTEFFPDYNELRCSTYGFGTEKMEIYRQKAIEYQPEWIRCYPSSGYVFARFLKDSGKSFPKIRGILCASEQLYDFQKELFRDVFGEDTRIFSHYGHYELAALAGYCEYTDDYHVLPQYGYVELLDDDDRPVTRPGAVGEIVATSFITLATPILRYRTGDLAVYKGFGCQECGRPHQIWQRTAGRTQEFIVTRNGRLISPTMLNMHDRTYEHLKQFQFHQSKRGSVTFKFVPKSSLDKALLGDLRRSIQSKLGDDLELILQPVDEILLTKRGKHRALVQELELSFSRSSLDEDLFS